MKSLIFCCWYVVLSVAIETEIPSGEQRCFQEVLKKDDPVTVQFVVEEGGDLDIDVIITNPVGGHLYVGEREHQGKYSFFAAEDGVHTVCLSNAFSSVTPKTVEFAISARRPLVGDPLALDQEHAHEPIDHATQNDVTTLMQQVFDLGDGLMAVKAEQEYHLARNRAHHAISDGANDKVLLWSLFEGGVIVFVAIWQVLYLRRFFEVKRFV